MPYGQSSWLPQVKATMHDFGTPQGKEPSEWEGWRALGMGFVQALGNVDRHNIQKRDDAKRYAFGVLGIGSLILTQLRYQHGDDLHIDN